MVPGAIVQRVRLTRYWDAPALDPTISTQLQHPRVSCYGSVTRGRIIILTPEVEKCRLHGVEGFDEYNQWRDPGGSFHYENAVGDTATIDPPVQGRWEAFPTNSPPFNNGGGRWLTSCGC